MEAGGEEEGVLDAGKETVAEGLIVLQKVPDSTPIQGPPVHEVPAEEGQGLAQGGALHGPLAGIPKDAIGTVRDPGQELEIEGPLHGSSNKEGQLDPAFSGLVGLDVGGVGVFLGHAAEGLMKIRPGQNILGGIAEDLDHPPAEAAGNLHPLATKGGALALGCGLDQDLPGPVQDLGHLPDPGGQEETGADLEVRREGKLAHSVLAMDHFVVIFRLKESVEVPASDNFFPGQSDDGLLLFAREDFDIVPVQEEIQEVLQVGPAGKGEGRDPLGQGENLGQGHPRPL